MLTIVAVMIAASQACTTVTQQCRACTITAGTKHCSNIGIACQPSLRICTPKDGALPSNGLGVTDRDRRPAKRATDA